MESAQLRFLRCGPFTFFRATGQMIFRIAVRGRSGTVCRGYARIGGAFGLGNHVKVIWDRGADTELPEDMGQYDDD